MRSAMDTGRKAAAASFQQNPVFLFMQCQGKDNACTCICVPCDTGVQCVPGETTADLVLFFLIQGTKYIH